MADESEITAPSIPQATFLRVAFDVLTKRFALYAMRWAAILLSASLFWWTVWQPHWIRLVASAAFTVLIAVPIVWGKRE